MLKFWKFQFFVWKEKQKKNACVSHGHLFWTPRQTIFGVMGLLFGPLGQFLMISWKQKRCATSVRSFWRLYQAISSHMDPFQTNFDANKHSQISRRRRRRRRLEIWECLLASKLVWNGSIWLDMAWYSRQNDRTDVAHLFCFQEIIKNWPRGPKRRPITPKMVCLGVQKRCPWLTQAFFFCFSFQTKNWNFQNFSIRPFRMSSY